MECMQYIKRFLEKSIKKSVLKGKSILLLGPRQTGKTTLIKQLSSDLYISFVRPDVRQRYEKAPELLLGEIEGESKKSKKGKLPLVVLDEIQKVPIMLDVVQDIIDNKKAQFILTGSSARKLR